MEWLAREGDQARVISTARFDGAEPADSGAELSAIGATRIRQSESDLLHYDLAGVSVTRLNTRFNDLIKPNRSEGARFLRIVDDELSRYRPDVVVSYGSHPVLQEAMKRSCANGTLVLFTVRNYGYERPQWFEYADRVLTCSPFLSRHYYRAIGLESAGLFSPIDEIEVVSSSDVRSFVTFVNPSIEKGAALFVRLAAMLGVRRPDIPLLVVASSSSSDSLLSVKGIDLAGLGNIVVCPRATKPSDIFELTRVLIVPSAFHEPFGRVAAEAMLNGVPAIVSERGSLPETVEGGGIVVPLPVSVTPESRSIPTEADVEPWYEAVCRLWDDVEWYASVAHRSLTTAGSRYGATVQTPLYQAFFRSVVEGRPFDARNPGLVP